MAHCAFCSIAAGTAPAAVVREWDDAIAIRPRSGGVHPEHVLVLPRVHVQDAGEGPAVTAIVMRRAAELMAEHEHANIITSKGTYGTQTQYHLHVHVVPRADGDGLPLPWTSQSDRDRLRAERDAAHAKLSVLWDRVEDAGSQMDTDYVREALEGGTARSVAEYVRAQEAQEAQEAGQ